MAKSQQSFNKKEREKQRLKKQQDKRERQAQRKAEKAENGGKSFEDMIAYVDEYGNFTDTPPDPNRKSKIKAEDIVIGIPPREDIPMEIIRKGQVKFFNDSKGFGFITDDETQESIFVHINNVHGDIRENDRVTFEIEKGPKGPSAVDVKLIPKGG
ncbi:MAG: cold shock domain-containing protein [Bacteroidia bacterium]|nr:cold shock domain-containing protein [Bacteroidia bacterium]